MNCPKCDQPMEKVKHANIEVDRCTGCKGIWFDMLEAEHLKALKGSGAVDVGDPKAGKRYDKIAKIKCPVCSEPMIRMVDARQHHIWYESCPVCYGLFFDAGEFRDFQEESILDRFRDLFTKQRK